MTSVARRRPKGSSRERSRVGRRRLPFVPFLVRWWTAFRYRFLLSRASASWKRGRTYARIVGLVEFSIDRPRRRTAVDRMERWLGVSRRRARWLFRRSLEIEAREEADSVRLIRHPMEFRAHLPAASELPELPHRVVFATMHTGAHVFAYAYLRKVCRLNVRAIARPIGPDDPMTEAKRRYAERKIAWLHIQLGVDLLGTDFDSLALAREHLLDDQPVFAAFDVPGDGATRTQQVCIGDEQLLAAAGVVVLARLVEATIVPIVALRTEQGVRLEYGAPVSPSESDPLACVYRQFAAFLRRWPEHWSLWPYVRPIRSAPSPAGALRAAPRLPSTPVAKPVRLTG